MHVDSASWWPLAKASLPADKDNPSGVAKSVRRKNVGEIDDSKAHTRYLKNARIIRHPMLFAAINGKSRLLTWQVGIGTKQ